MKEMIKDSVYYSVISKRRVDRIPEDVIFYHIKKME